MTFSAVRLASFSSGSPGWLTASLVWTSGCSEDLRITGEKKPGLRVPLKKPSVARARRRV